jgi:hypothetical protein
MSVINGVRVVRWQLRVLAAAAALALCLPAQSEVNDPPYWNLWDGSPGSGQTVLGQGGQITLCGTSTSGGTCDPTGEGIFRALDPNSGAGSGHILPFLRFSHSEKSVQGTYTEPSVYQTYVDGAYSETGATSADAGVEGAYNTNAGQHWTDLQGRSVADTFINQAKDAPGTKFNHAVNLSDFDLSGGTAHFLLDINEPNGGVKEILRMDELKIFVASTPELNDYDPYAVDGTGTDGSSSAVEVSGTFDPSGTTAVKVWDMDWDKYWTQPSGANNHSACSPANGSGPGCGGVNLNNEVGTGGSGDLDYELILDSQLFIDAVAALGLGADLSKAWVFLYNYAGAADTKPLVGEVAQADFEEWIYLAKAGVVPPLEQVPAPGTGLLLGSGLLGLIGLRRVILRRV